MNKKKFRKQKKERSSKKPTQAELEAIALRKKRNKVFKKSERSKALFFK